MSAPAAPSPDLAARLAALRDPAVRDLAWLLYSADLLRPSPTAPLAELWESPEEAASTAAWLRALDCDAQALHDALAAARATRLGRYAEELLGWFLREGPHTRLVAANVALRLAGRTIGECDFLVETSRGRRLHWELAVKCYLCVERGDGSLSDFVGPNLRDRFDRKRAHLLDHQLRVSARAEFAALCHPGPWIAQMLIKGWLFYRAGAGVARTTHAGPAALASAHPRGWWVTHADWPAFADAQQAAGWSVLPRLAWLAPRRLDREAAADRTSPAADYGNGNRSGITIAPPAPPQTLTDSFEPQPEPLMVAAFSLHDDGYRELSRGFIVPDDWPARALAFSRE